MDRLLTLTFDGHVNWWWHILPISSIHSLDQLAKNLDKYFDKYNYRDLCGKINILRIKPDELVEDFYNQFLHLCYEIPKKHLNTYYICTFIVYGKLSCMHIYRRHAHIQMICAYTDDMCNFYISTYTKVAHIRKTCAYAAMSGLYTYLFNNETWNTICTQMWLGSAIWYSTSLILSKICKGPQ